MTVPVSYNTVGPITREKTRDSQRERSKAHRKICRTPVYPATVSVREWFPNIVSTAAVSKSNFRAETGETKTKKVSLSLSTGA